MYNIVTFKCDNRSIYIKNKNKYTVLVLLKANVICCAFARRRQHTCVCGILLSFNNQTLLLNQLTVFDIFDISS